MSRKDSNDLASRTKIKTPQQVIATRLGHVAIIVKDLKMFRVKGPDQISSSAYGRLFVNSEILNCQCPPEGVLVRFLSYLLIQSVFLQAYFL
jgi:hypothetical protein